MRQTASELITTTADTISVGSIERRSQPRRAADRRLAAMARLAWWFAERETHPLFIVDSNLNVSLSNHPAREWLRTKKLATLRGGRLVWRNAAIHQALITALSKGRNLNLQPLKHTYTIRLLRIDTLSGNELFALSCEQHETHTLSATQLARKFGLTAAEAAVTIELFNGATLSDIASKRKTSINTVKTQVRLVFQKFRVKTRVGLVRRIAPHG